MSSERQDDGRRQTRLEWMIDEFAHAQSRRRAQRPVRPDVLQEQQLEGPEPPPPAELFASLPSLPEPDAAPTAVRVPTDRATGPT